MSSPLSNNSASSQWIFLNLTNKRELASLEITYATQEMLIDSMASRLRHLVSAN